MADEIHKAAQGLYDLLFDQIEADDFDDACSETYPAGREAWWELDAPEEDVHYEATLCRVIAELAEMLARRSRGEQPSPLEEP